MSAAHLAAQKATAGNSSASKTARLDERAMMSILDRFRLDGKRLFITGGSRGLGREMALAIADAGADVVLTGRDRESLNQTAAEIEKLGRNAVALQADMGDTDQCAAACREALEKCGRIDILINNVGGRRENIALAEMELEDWRRLMDLNLTSAFLCMKILGGEMVRRGEGGRVINISSINACVVGRNIGGRHYETAKAGLLQLTRAAAVDWAPQRVTVNAILPGPFMTEANQRWQREIPEVINAVRGQVPLGDYGPPEDLGPLAVYLASDAARYVTGAAMVIDGGYTLH